MVLKKRMKGYEVFIMASPIVFPFNFAYHCWIITNKKGKIDRWEVYNIFPNSWKKRVEKFLIGDSEYLYKNSLSPKEGVNVFFFLYTPRWKSRILHTIRGVKAKNIINFIEKNAPSYVNRSSYRYYPGPNSNTFVQWILDNTIKMKLPRRAIGSKYSSKLSK